MGRVGAHASGIFIARNPLKSLHSVGRLAKSEEIADTVIWLCSNEASFVLGQAIAVDGGFTAI
ncbi:MAG: SDR family oxidoreductase [Cyanobacteria bacterium P01_F01_bin.86]